jgi:hypothetical protein
MDATTTKPAKPWIPLSVPGRLDDGSDCAWFAYHRESRESVACASAEAAAKLCRARNERAGVAAG